MPTATPNNSTSISGSFGSDYQSLPHTPGLPPLFWPCVGEHPVYDGNLYNFLSADEMRNDLYRSGIGDTVAGKIVVDIGTGDQAHWAIECIRAGAKKAYAIEQNPKAAALAQELVSKLGLADRITVLVGRSTEINLPELADVCISEILGEIGSAEGAITTLNDAKNRLMKTGGEFLPERCNTFIAPVQLPTELITSPTFDPDALPYLNHIFAAARRPFDVRVSISNLGNSYKLPSIPTTFESLNFSGQIEQNSIHGHTFVISDTAELHGFLLWLSIECRIGAGQLDTLLHKTNWFPVFFPVWPNSLPVTEGDSIECAFSRHLSDDGMHPNYAIEGIVRSRAGNEQNFMWKSDHHSSTFLASDFYKELFA